MAAMTIAIMSPGDMGHRVGEHARTLGHRIVTALEGRSDVTRMRAQRAGIEDMGDLAVAADDADILLSIMPPERAEGFAAEAIPVLARLDNPPLFVDCNAISPITTRTIAQRFEDVGLAFANASIIGNPPGSGGQPTKIYASGVLAHALDVLDSDGISVRQMGPDLVRASAIKMCYAGLTKGLLTLQTAMLLTGEMLGVYDELAAELADSQPNHWAALGRRGPFLATTAGRYAGEMDEIAETLGSVGLTANLHTGASEIFRFLASTSLGAETPETQDRERTLEQTMKIYRVALNQCQGKDSAAE